MFCIPIVAENTTDALTKMTSIGANADILEVRLDLMQDFDLEKILGFALTPVLVTYRSLPQGGKGQAEPNQVCQYLLDAIDLGADLVDVELTMPHDIRKKIIRSKRNTKAIVSMHINDHTPSWKKLWSVFEQAASCDADIVKIVTYASTWEDNLRVLELIPRAKKSGTDIIAFCMGTKGKISRVMSHLMGGYMSFVAATPPEQTAPGQMTLQEFKETLEIFGHEG